MPESVIILSVQILGLALLGIGVGVFSTGFGLGGGVLMVPAFITFIPGMDLHTAKGTSLFIILLVALSGYPRLRKAQIERPGLQMTLWLICGALTGGYVGAVVSTRLSEHAVLIAFLLFVAFLILQLLRKQPIKPIKRTVVHTNIVLFLIGLGAGVAGSATGTGGGALLAPLVLLSGMLPHTQIVYMANQVIIATSLAAAPAHFMAEPLFARYFTVGHIALGLVPIMVAAAQAGVILGVKVNLKLDFRQRRRILALVLGLVIARMLAQL